MNLSKIIRRQVKLTKKYEYTMKLMAIADAQLSDNPDLVEKDLYTAIIDEAYEAKRALDTFENRVLMTIQLERFKALKS